MHTFAQKTKATQQATPAKSTIPRSRTRFWQSREVSSILHLQRTIGNQAVQRLFQANTEEPIAPTVTTSPTRFAYDFSQVPAHPSGHVQLGNQNEFMPHMLELERPPSLTQAKAARSEVKPSADSSERQADSVGAAIGRDLNSMGTITSGPLPGNVQTVAERHLAVDLSGTLLHANVAGHQRAESEGALAVTEGTNVSFAEGQLDTSSSRGRAILGHELTHVAQQKAHGLKSVQLKRGTGIKKTFHGITFEKDAKGRLILTGKILYDAMRDSYNTYLKSESRYSGLEDVKRVMSLLDTVFYDISQDPKHKHEKFVWLESEFSAEEVNYIGVGLGFDHFHIFLHSFKVAQAMVLLWNLTKYGHIASFGEHFWAAFGMWAYKKVK